jgi:hypothetical protein
LTEASEIVDGEKVVEGELWIVVVRSKASRRKRAVFWRAGRGVVVFIVGRKVVSQVWEGGRALEVRWVASAVARSGFGVVVVVVVGTGAGGWRRLAIWFVIEGCGCSFFWSEGLQQRAHCFVAGDVVM